MKVYSGNPNKVRKTAHRMPTKAVKKCAHTCIDGPMKGQTLYLTDGTTAVFTLNGQTGHYNNGEWQQC